MIEVDQKLFIIGGYDCKSYLFEENYLLDIWSFDFTQVCFKKENLSGPNQESLKRSNHSAIYYKPHNS